VKITNIALRVLKILGITILVIIGLVLLPLIIGFIVDLAVTPQWSKAQQESVDYFARLRSQRYKSISLPFVTLEKNAWGYYDKASKLIDKPSHLLGNYLVNDLGEIELGKDSLEVSLADSLVQKYDKAYALFDSGACCRYYTIPDEYQNEPAKPLVSDRIPSLARLAVIQGRLEMAEGNPRAAAEIYAKVLKMGSEVGSAGEAYSAPLFASDISSGGNVFAGRLVGIDIGDAAVYQSISDLDKFDLESVSYLLNTISRVEKNWPPLDSALEAKGRLLLLPSITGWDGLQIDHIYFISSEPYQPGSYVIGGWPADLESDRLPSWARGVVFYSFLRVPSSIFAWRQLFSVRLSFLYGIKKITLMAERCRTIRPQTWKYIEPEVKAFRDTYEKDAWRLGMPAIFAHSSVDWICDYYNRYLVEMRLLKCALWLREYKLKHKKYPDSLNAFLSSDTAYYDPDNNHPLHVTMDSTGQKIRLYSVGQNLKDDEGKNNWEDKDDIWIELR
jgi:hypothetical protein